MTKIERLAGEALSEYENGKTEPVDALCGEIPAEMLDAATAKYMNVQGYSEKRIKQAKQDRDAAWQDAARRTLFILEAAGVQALLAENAALKAELSRHQESQFHPDWSALKETRESLREAWAKLKEMEQTAADALMEAGE